MKRTKQERMFKKETVTKEEILFKRVGRKKQDSDLSFPIEPKPESNQSITIALTIKLRGMK